MTLQEQIKSRISKQHCLGCKVAFGVNILWGISNYFIFSENKWTYVTINLCVAAIILTSIIIRTRLKISGENMGLIAMLSTLTAFAYIYNTADLIAFQKLTFTHAAAFIGAGMFLLWHYKYSIISVAYAILINSLYYFLFSKINIDDYLIQGALMVMTTAFFMVVSIQVRYALTIKEIEANIRLSENQRLLKQSSEQHKVLFNENPIPMLICSIETDKILKINFKAEQAYGYNLKEFKKLSILDLHLSEDRLEAQRNFSSDKSNVRSIWSHQKKDATIMEVEIIEKIIDYKGRPSRLLSINDITNVKNYEKKLIRAKQEAEKSKEMQSQFLSNMSHEIRTPMNGIIGITRILQNTEMDKEQKHFLNAIIKSSENLMVIINDILDFSKIDAGKVTIEKTEFDLDNLLTVNQEIMAIKAQEKGIYLTVDKDPSVPNWIIGDPVRLNQILTNLVGNAIKFTETGGVNIAVKTIESTQTTSKIKFSVSDTGIGIPSDKIDDIFKSFTQASDSTTRTHGGTGLGLTISKQLVELQDGQIWIESEFGKGSTFNFVITYSHAIQNTENNNKTIVLKKITNEKILEELKGINILLVEDHPINQMLAIKVLTDWGFNVDLAENGLISLKMVGEKEYDLILMDISMPEMDGYTATKEIRSGAHTSYSQIPIVAMTASALIGENQKCFKAGMNDYITKPFDPQNLLEKISNQVISKLKRA